MRASSLQRACRDALAGIGIAHGRLLLAVSGGRDSVVLLDLVRAVAPELDPIWWWVM